MKTVFPSREVAHIWASQQQEEGRTSTRNFFFEGDTIFSYGHHFPIARIEMDKKTVFFSKRNYSNTTSKHKGHARHAIPDEFLVIETNNVTKAYPSIYSGTKPVKTKQYYKDIFDELFKDLWAEKALCLRATKWFEYKEKNCQSIASKIIKFNNLYKVKRNLKEIDIFTEEEVKKLDEKEKKLKIWEDAAEKRREERNRLAALKERENLAKWIAGDPLYYSFYNIPEAYLRIKDDMIETSKGAKCKLASAHVLYDMIKAGKDIKGHNIDGYTVISLNGELKIGCHKIPLTEIDRIAALLGWDKPKSEVITAIDNLIEKLQ